MTILRNCFLWPPGLPRPRRPAASLAHRPARAIYGHPRMPGINGINHMPRHKWPAKPAAVSAKTTLPQKQEKMGFWRKNILFSYATKSKTPLAAVTGQKVDEKTAPEAPQPTLPLDAGRGLLHPVTPEPAGCECDPFMIVPQPHSCSSL